MIEIFATDENGDSHKITDLYWFEENMVYDWGGYGHAHKYTFEIRVNGVRVYPSVSHIDFDTKEYVYTDGTRRSYGKTTANRVSQLP